MKTRIKKIAASVLLMTMAWSAHAASVLLVPTSNTVDLQPGERVTFEIVWDFSTDTNGLGSDITLGGGFDVVYDADAFAFVDFDFGGLGDCGFAGCDPDELPGLLFNFSFGSFNGITGPDVFGEVEFEVLPTAPASAFVMTRATDGIGGPFISAIDFITILDVEFGAVEVTTVPVPAAVWLLLSSVGILTGFGRNRAGETS